MKRPEPVQICVFLKCLESSNGHDCSCGINVSVLQKAFLTGEARVYIMCFLCGGESVVRAGVMPECSPEWYSARIGGGGTHILGLRMNSALREVPLTPPRS